MTTDSGNRFGFCKGIHRRAFLRFRAAGASFSLGHWFCWRGFVFALINFLSFNSASGAQATDASERLNIISIVTDDQARWAVGAYGNREVRTPNLDRLSRDGARFLNAFCSTPVCSPSRASFLSGRWGSQVGITDWLHPSEAEKGMGLARDAVTWPQVLHEHGYTTGLIGKWHLGTKPPFHPRRRGFDHFYGFLGGGNTPMDPFLEVEGREQQLKGSLPDLLVDDAIRFVNTNRDHPFCLLLHFRAPHDPYGPVPKIDSAPFKDLDPTIPRTPGIDVSQVKNWTRDYYASIHSVDRNLGRLVNKLEELGLSRKTILLFTSDHGYMIGHHGLHGKGNAEWIAGGVLGPKRPNMFDDSVRVPLLIRWPGAVRGGTEIHEAVSNIDIFSSVLGMLKIPLPRGLKSAGSDFSSLLHGEKIPWRDAIFGEYDLHNGGLAYMRMIRTSEWKLVRHYRCNFRDELYHLSDDPGEQRNLYNDNRSQPIRDQLQKRLTAWQRSLDDALLQSVPLPTGRQDEK